MLLGRVDSGVRIALLTVGLLWAGAGVAAASVSNRFDVTVSLQNPESGSAFCRTGSGAPSFGAVVTVVCATGAVVGIQAPANASVWQPVHGGAYQFHRLSNDLLGVRISGAIDTYIGTGTVTSWRWVTLADRDYLELLLGW